MFHVPRFYSVFLGLALNLFIRIHVEIFDNYEPVDFFRPQNLARGILTFDQLSTSALQLFRCVAQYLSRYTYNCCELKSKYHSCCKKMFTKYSKIRFGVAKLLGRHSVQCPHRYFISSFHLTMDKSKKKWRYNFICCKLLPQ